MSSDLGRRVFFRAVFGLGAAYAFLSHGFIQLISQFQPKESSRLENFLRLTGLSYFVKAPNRNLSERIDQNQNFYLSRDLVDQASALSLSGQVIQEHMDFVVSSRLRDLIEDRIPDQHKDEIIGFFQSNVGQRFARCMSDIPFNREVNLMAAEILKLKPAEISNSESDQNV